MAQTLPEYADTIVIGGGTGGAALAGTLVRHSTDSVLLLESGPDYGHRLDDKWPTDMLDARSIPLSHDYDLSTRATSGVGVLDLPRARILGGCSAHNGCTASIGAAFEYDEWAAAGNPGWTAEEVKPLLGWARSQFRIRRYTMDELTPPQRAFVEAGVQSGLPFADDLDELEAAEGIGPMPVNIVGGTRWNSAFAFLDEVRDRDNLTIVGEATVRRIRFDGTLATGVVVEVDGVEHSVDAGRVVLAAGAYHSPALLLASGIGPDSDLNALGIDTLVDLPGVGEHLLDHSCVQLDFTGKPGLLDELAALDWNPDEQTVGRARSTRCDDGPYDIHVFMVAGANTGHPDLPPITLYGGAMRARSEGKVTLNSDLDVQRPVIDHRYGTDEYDRQVLSEALDLLHDITEQPALADVLGEFVPSNAGEPLDNIVNYCHPAGSCKMGPASDRSAVVDHRGQVHGVESLYIADASIMPSITRGNINLPTAMIGARVAAGLLDLDPSEIVLARAVAAPVEQEAGSTP